MLTCWRRAVKVTDWQTYTGDNVNVLLCVVVGDVTGVTLLHNVVYIVCWESSSIIRFDAVTHRRLADITVNDMTSPPVSRQLSCMSLSIWSVSGECRQTAKMWSACCQSHRRTGSDQLHYQWRQRHHDCWWRHAATPNNWDSSTQSAMNWVKLICLVTCTHITPWSHQQECSSSVTTTHNWSSIRSVKSTLEVKCCVSSAVHIYYHSAGLNTSLLTHKETYL